MQMTRLAHRLRKSCPPAALLLVFFVVPISAGGAGDDVGVEFHLASEQSLDSFGGIPFCVDLDSDGRSDVLWLQSPGLFHSKVFDKVFRKKPFSEAEKAHFCLTATDADGKVLWRIGEPWSGDRPFVSHSAERALDCADVDGDGTVEVVCVRRDELLVIDAVGGTIEKLVKAPADNAQIVVAGRTGPGPGDWTILAKNAESAYSPHQYANPAWFYDPSLKLLKTADYLGAGHTPLALDIDGDGLDEFLIGFNLIDHDLTTLWTFQPVEPEKWNAGEMHVDDLTTGELGGRTCVAYAASDMAFLLDAKTGKLIWKYKGVHPQHCQIGCFLPQSDCNQVFIHNKRSYLQLLRGDGRQLWRMDPPRNFPLGQAAPCRAKKFHVFDPTTVLEGVGPGGSDLLIFTDAGWPYLLDSRGRPCMSIPHPPNSAQDWGEVPGRPDDYGYGFYARAADFDGDGSLGLLINDRRFAWFYRITRKP